MVRVDPWEKAADCARAAQAASDPKRQAILTRISAPLDGARKRKRPDDRTGSGERGRTDRPRAPRRRQGLSRFPAARHAAGERRNYVMGIGLVPRMFIFLSNGLGVAGSIIVSIALTLLLLYACSGP